MNVMKVCLKFIIGLLCIFALTGCIGEDYDVGPPTAYMDVDSSKIKLKEANILWSTGSMSINKVTKSIQQLASKQKQINVSPLQSVNLEFEENKENGGEYTDVSVNVFLWQDNKQEQLECNDNTFTFPNKKGNYMLEVDFYSHQGDIKYVGNVAIK
jgi:hypothetical protein